MVHSIIIDISQNAKTLKISCKDIDKLFSEINEMLNAAFQGMRPLLKVDFIVIKRDFSISS